MATGGQVGFVISATHPGNSEFPQLPTGNPQGIILAPFATLGSVSPGIQDEQQLDVHGQVSAGTTDWYTDTIWATPVPVEFGSISADVDRLVTLHNTFKTGITLNSIDASAVPGITVQSPALPAAIGSFSSLVVTLRATTDGPTSFDGLITLNFSTGSQTLRVTGQRILIFNHPPERGIIEKLGYKTDIQRSRNGSEKAYALRSAARRDIRYRIRFNNDVERQRIHNLVLGGGPQLLIGCQQWQEARPITAAALTTDTVINVDTTNTTHAVGRGVTFVLPDKSHVEGVISAIAAGTVTLVQAIGTALPLGTYAMPILNGFVSRYPRINVYPKTAEDFELQFVITDTPNIAAIPSLITTPHPVDSLPILTRRNLMRGNRKKAGLERNDRRFDSGIGPIFVDGTEPIGEYSFEYASHAPAPAEIYAWRQLFDHLLGSWGLFYVATDQPDLPLSADLNANTNTLTIPNMGVRNFLNAQAPRRDVKIVHPQGTDYRRIASVTDNGATETITLTATTSNAAVHTPANVQISWLTLCRIAGDAATFAHKYHGVADVNFNCRSVIQ